MTAALRLFVEAPSRVAQGTLQIRGTARVREAVRIRLRDADGTVGEGESIPFPGYSLHDADAVERVLQSCAQRAGREGLLLGPDTLRAPDAAARLAAALAPYDDLLGDVAGARFALECALVDLLSRRAGLSGAQWLAEGRPLQTIAVSVLLPDDERAAIASALEAVARGHTVLKLKIARADRSFEEEEAFLASLRTALDAACGGDSQRVRLRLDANGALPPERAPERLAALVRYGIELVEEPVAGSALLAMPALALPWAADESLADAALAESLLDLPPERRPAALVLKPAQLGLSRCLSLAHAAAARNIGVIVTHSLDGDVGFAAACALALALPVAPWPCGLAPHAGLHRPPKSQAWLTAPSGAGLAL